MRSSRKDCAHSPSGGHWARSSWSPVSRRATGSGRVVVDVPDVTGLVEVCGAGVPPDHEHRLVARVLESVIVVLRNEDDLTRPELDVGITNARDSPAGDEILELLGIRVPVD